MKSANNITLSAKIAGYVKSVTSAKERTTMSEPYYLSGDPFSNFISQERVQEVECGYCGHIAEVPSQENYSHSEVTWFAEWTCSKCGESCESEGWYDPNFND